MLSIDLNCDMGEGFDSDYLIMPFISSANIACGGHAGNAESMRETILLAMKHGVRIGAHPTYPDKQYFGRKKIDCSIDEIKHFIHEQLTHFLHIANELNATVSHVKPHGALYNASADDMQIALAIAETIKNFREDLILYGLSNSCSGKAAEQVGLRFCSEVFADRTYTDQGRLTPRSSSNALMEDVTDSLKQVLYIIKQQEVISTTGYAVAIHADTICIHGDGAHAVEFAKAIHEGMNVNQIKISPFDIFK
jgi:UPF0271 protein